MSHEKPRSWSRGLRGGQGLLGGLQSLEKVLGVGH